MKKDLIKIAIRFVLLAVMLVTFNYLYKYLWFEDDLQEHSPIINKVRAVQDTCEVVYIGESSNITYHWDDIDKRPISEMMADYYPELKIGDITKGALHAGNYYILLKNIPKESPVKTVIVTLNLRSFNAQWIYSRLETALLKSMVLLKDAPPLYNRFVLAFKGYEIVSNKERSRQVVRKWKRDDFHSLPFDFWFKDTKEWNDNVGTNGAYNPDGTRDFSRNTLASHYVKAYALQIDPEENPRIKDFDNIVKLAKERGWNLVFNLMAENHEKAFALLQDPILYFFEYNRKLLIDRYTNMGVIVVDNLYAVEDSSFIDQHWTTEHYDEKGRKIIAKNVADSLKSLYSEFYVGKPQEKVDQVSYVINTCDKKENWPGSGTLSNEKAYSGEFSSRIMKGKAYSIAYICKPSSIPEDNRKKVKISAWVNVEELNERPNITLEVRKKGRKNFFYKLPVIEQVQETNKWMKVTTTIELPYWISLADEIRIYAINPTESPVFIDDLEINFQP